MKKKTKGLFKKRKKEKKINIFSLIIKARILFKERKVIFLFIWHLQNVPESVPEFCSICPRKMSFVPEKHPESPRMAPEKYGMYDTQENTHGGWGCISMYIYSSSSLSINPSTMLEYRSMKSVK